MKQRYVQRPTDVTNVRRAVRSVSASQGGGRPRTSCCGRATGCRGLLLTSHTSVVHRDAVAGDGRDDGLVGVWAQLDARVPVRRAGFRHVGRRRARRGHRIHDIVGRAPVGLALQRVEDAVVVHRRDVAVVLSLVHQRLEAERGAGLLGGGFGRGGLLDEGQRLADLFEFPFERADAAVVVLPQAGYVALDLFDLGVVVDGDLRQRPSRRSSCSS